MKLQKFIKDKKVKNTFLVSIVALVLVIGGVTFYRTFAFYEEKESFDVLIGVVPDFINDDFKKLVDIIDSHAKNYDELLTNEEDVDHIVESKEAMDLIKDSDVLKDKIKTNEAYPTIVEKFLNSTVLTDEEKYNAGLPCYLYNKGTISSMIGSFGSKYSYTCSHTPFDPSVNFSKNTSGEYVVYASNINTYFTTYSENKINLKGYSHLAMNYDHGSNGTRTTGTTTLGLADDQDLDTFTISNAETYNAPGMNSTLVLDISSNQQDSYVKFKVRHNGLDQVMTVSNKIYTISLY